jgi:uncharacterized protein YdeI (YjbR/CyaY-like superfamily)
MNPKVDFYFAKAGRWQQELEALRRIVLDCGLTEELKWGVPCYRFRERNIVLIHVFKEYCAFLFFKGALMQNDHGLLVQQTENVQAARQIRFTDAGEIRKLDPVLRACIFEAVSIEEAGLKVAFKKEPEPVPEEFQRQLDAVPGLKAAFGDLTPGRQRAYMLHFNAPKQSSTRAARVEKCLPQILAGKGLND